MNDRKNSKKGKSVVLRRVMLALLGLTLGVNIYLTNAQSIVGNPMPMPLGTGAAVVLSGSMEPTLQIGDLLFVRKTENPALDDIVVYQSGASLIVHRVVRLDGDMIVTKGDANNTPDEPIRREQVRGTVKMRIPHLGTLLNALKTPLGMMATLVVAFLLVELSCRRQQDAETKELDAVKAEIRRLKEELEHKEK